MNWIHLHLLALLLALPPLPSTACRVSAPFTAHTLVSLTPTAPQVDFLHRLLTPICELLLLSPDQLRPSAPAMLILTPPQFAALSSAARDSSTRHLVPPYRVLSSDMEQMLRRMPSQSDEMPASSPYQARAVDDAFYKRYHSLPALRAKWASLATRYAHVTVESIGKSVEGREITLIRVGRTPGSNPQRVVLNSMQHAREWISVHAVTYVAEALAELAEGTSEDGGLLENVEFLIVPLMNPDGYVYTNTTFRFARKNRRPTGCTFPDGDGVDLNRNWSTDYGGTGSTSSDGCSNVYIGAGAFSEPETAAVRDLILSTDGIKVHLDIHSYGQLVLPAWGFTTSDPPREAESTKIGKILATALREEYDKLYRFSKAGELIYLASGTMTDWVTSQGVLSYTFELRPSLFGAASSGFVLEEEEILPTSRETFAAAQVLLRYANNARSVESSTSPAVSNKPPPGGAQGSSSPPPTAPQRSATPTPSQTSDVAGPLPETGQGSATPTPTTAVCIDARALGHLKPAEKVFDRDMPAKVLCDALGSCATPGHMVLFRGEAMMMKRFCAKIGCVERVLRVNSPRYRRKLTVASKTGGLVYTSFAARYESKAEEAALRLAIRAGF